MVFRNLISKGYVVGLLGAVAIANGSIWLLWWLSGIAARWSAEGVITVKTNMAVCQLLSGLGLVLLAPREMGDLRRRLGKIMAAVVLVTGALTLSEHLFSYNLGIDQLLAREPAGAVATASANRMGPPGSSSLMLVGAGLMFLAYGRARLAAWVGVCLCVINLIPAVGFLYGITGFYSNPRLTGISWSTVVALLSVGAGLVLARPDQGPASQMLRDDAGGILLRRVVPAVIVIPLVLGYLRVQGERLGRYGTAAGTGTLTVIIVVGFLLILWRTAAVLSQLAESKAKAEAKLREKEQRYRRLFDDDLTGDFISTPEGRILLCNPAFARMFGFSSVEEAVGTNVVDLYVDPGERELLMERLRSEGKIDRLEVWRKGRSGAPIYIVENIVGYFGERGELCEVGAYLFDDTKRKRAEEALRESEKRLASFAAATFEGIVESESGRIVDCNEQFAEIVKYTVAELKGMRIADLVCPEDRERVAANVLQGRDSVLEHGVLQKDGTRIVVEAHGRSMAPGSHTRHTAIRDITERKQAEEKVRESEERLGAFLENSAVIAWLKDEDGRHVFLSKNYEQRFGVRLADWQGKTDFEVWPRAIAEEFRRNDQMVLASPRPIEVVESTTGNDGSKSWWLNHKFTFRDAAGRRYVGGLGVDITQRQRAEEALRESEAHAWRQFEELEAIYRTAPVGLGVLDRDLRYRRINSRLAEMNGVTTEKHIGKTVREVVPALGDQAEEALRRVIETRQAVHFEFSGKTPSQPGIQRVWDEQWFPLWGQTGEIEGVGIVVEDITERKAFQAELERLVAERTAELRELVGELEHFSYSITHDMRAPLRAMMGFGEAAKELCPECGHEEQKAFLDRIQTAARRMDLLITDALNYSKAVRSELPLAPIDVGRLLRGMVHTYPELQVAEGGIRIEPELPLVMANEAGLTQCFSNLLVNAVKYAKPGELPDVRVWAEALHPQPANPNSQPQPWVRLWVEDKGIGIPPKMLPRVFDMFTRGHSGYEGTGIGLALVRKVVHRMGGRVGVESEEGKGSRFWIELKSGEVESALA